MVVVKDSINRISFEIVHKIFITFHNMRLYSNLLSWSPVFWGVEIFFRTYFQAHLPYRKANFCIISEFHVLPLWIFFYVFFIQWSSIRSLNFERKIHYVWALFPILLYVSRNEYSLHDAIISVIYTTKYKVYFHLPRSTECIK